MAIIYGHIITMKEMLVSEFKSECIATLNQVAANGEEVLITKRGTPLVRVVPVRDVSTSKRIPGDCSESVKIHGDIVGFDSSDDWEALKG